MQALSPPPPPHPHTRTPTPHSHFISTSVRPTGLCMRRRPDLSIPPPCLSPPLLFLTSSTLLSRTHVATTVPDRSSEGLRFGRVPILHELRVQKGVVPSKLVSSLVLHLSPCSYLCAPLAFSTVHPRCLCLGPAGCGCTSPFAFSPMGPCMSCGCRVKSWEPIPERPW